MGSDGDSADGGVRDGRPGGDSPHLDVGDPHLDVGDLHLSNDKATDAVGEVRSSPTAAAERLGRLGAILPGRTVGQSFMKALAAGALLGSGIGLISGVALVALGMGAPNAYFAVVVGLIGALIGVFVGLVCGGSAALAVLAAVWFGASKRSTKSGAGAVGAALSVLTVAAIVEGNGLPSATRGFPFGLAGVFLVLIAAAAAALSMGVLDSDARRVAAVQAPRTPQAPVVANASPASSPSTGIVGDAGSAARRGPPPIPRRPGRDVAAGPESTPSQERQESETHDPVPVAPDSAPVAAVQSLNRARQFRSVAVILGILSLISVPWMLLALGSAVGGTLRQQSGNALAWYAAQFFVAAAIPAGALGVALASGVASRRASRQGVSDADLTPTPSGVAVLTSCILVVTLLSGMALLGTVAQARDAYAEQQFSPDAGRLPWDQEGYEDQPPPAATETNPEIPATPLGIAEVDDGMQTLLDTAVAAAGPTAVWRISRGDGTSRALDEASSDVPTIVSVEACGDAGMSYLYPDVSFTTGVITDTSTDEHDREVTDGNVAAAERIVAAWQALGYNEDSGMGGNIDLAGSAGLPAKSLHVRYSFGLVTLVRVSQCLPQG